VSSDVYPVFPGILPEVERIQEYNTINQEESGGRTLGLASRSQARHTWKINYGYLSWANARLLTYHVHKHKGQWDSFLFTDPVTPTADQWNFNSGIGSGTFYSTGNGVWNTAYLTDWLTDPVAAQGASAIVIRVNGVVQTLTTHYTLDTTNGALRIVFVTAPGNGLSVDWSGSYYRRVKFTEDGLRIKQVVSGIYTASVSITSQVLP
jgi:hypothetical protein